VNLGFLAACPPDRRLQEIAAGAAAQGDEALDDRVRTRLRAAHRALGPLLVA
jgi:hypothetical protein